MIDRYIRQPRLQQDAVLDTLIPLAIDMTNYKVAYCPYCKTPLMMSVGQDVVKCPRCKKKLKVEPVPPMPMPVDDPPLSIEPKSEIQAIVDEIKRWGVSSIKEIVVKEEEDEIEAYIKETLKTIGTAHMELIENIAKTYGYGSYFNLDGNYFRIYKSKSDWLDDTPVTVRYEKSITKIPPF